MKNYYEVLGVPTDATSDDIKKAHRRISAKTYSRTGKADEGDTARFIEANQAYKVLYNSDTRKAYDLENFTVISKVTEVSTDPKPASESTRAFPSEAGRNHNPTDRHIPAGRAVRG